MPWRYYAGQVYKISQNLNLPNDKAPFATVTISKPPPADLNRHESSISILPSMQSPPPDLENIRESSTERRPNSNEDCVSHEETGSLLSLRKVFMWRFWGLTDEQKKRRDEIYGYDRFRHEKIEDSPKGLPRLAAYLNNDQHLALYRRFGKLFARNLLHLQIELHEIEQEIDTLDKKDAKDPTHAQLMAFDEPRMEHYKSIIHFVNEQRPLAVEQENFIFDCEDYIAVKNYLDKPNIVTKALEFASLRWPDLFSKIFLKDTPGHCKIANYASKRIQSIANVIYICLAITVILTPVFILVLVPMTRAMMVCTITFSTLIFCITVLALTKAKVQEIFLGAAASALPQACRQDEREQFFMSQWQQFPAEIRQRVFKMIAQDPLGSKNNDNMLQNTTANTKSGLTRY
ncbi:hypothetical protein B7463_g3035, partial [Scytalidium lignicola]